MYIILSLLCIHICHCFFARKNEEVQQVYAGLRLADDDYWKGWIMNENEMT